MPIATRLLSTGTLLVNGTFDETSQSTISTRDNLVLAGEFDELSLPAGAISLNGSSQYLTVPAGASWALSTGDFTIEWFQYMTSQNANPRVFSVGTYSSASIAVSIEGGTFYVWEASGFRFSFSLTAGGYLNQWIHFAISRVSGTTKVFKNGTQIGSSYADTYNINNSATVLTIGNESTPSAGSNFAGYISNFRIIKGTGIYTGNFTVPQSILPAITNTQLLLNVTDSVNFIKDNSANKNTVTNNGTATFTANGPFNRGSTTTAQRQLPEGTLEVYSQFDEFTGAPVVDGNLKLWLDAGQTSSYSGLGTTWTDLSGNGRNGTLTNGPTYSNTNGGSIVFDGTDDFVQCSGSLTVTAATFVAWIRRNGTQGQWDGILFSRGTNVTGMNFYTSNQLGYHWNNNSATYAWNSGLTVPDLTWCMIAVSVTSTLATAYLCQSSGITSATNTVSHDSSTLDDIKIAQDDTGGRFSNGAIATAMVYDRALSADEIQTNFNALRGRYGI